MSVLDTSHVPTPRSSDATASADPVTTRWPLLPIVVTAVAIVGTVARFAADTPLWLDEALSV